MKRNELKKPFTLRDFEREKDPIERLRMCLLQREFLPYLKDDEYQKFNQLTQAFALIRDAKNLLVPAEQIIGNTLDGGKFPNHAKKIHAETQELFSFALTEKEVLKNIMAEFHWELAQKAKNIAENPQDLDYASRIAERASKLMGLDKLAEAPIDISKIRMPDFVELTDDPSVLQSQKKLIDTHGNSDDDSDE